MARATRAARRADRRRASAAGRRASRAGRRTSTSRPPSSSSRASCRGRCSAPSGCPSTSGTGCPSGTWVGLDNYRAVLTDPELRAPVPALVGPAGLLLQRLPIVLGTGARRADVARPAARARRLPHRHLPAAGGRDGRGGDRVAAHLRARRPAQRRAVAPSASTRSPGPGSATRRSRCSAVGLVGTWVGTGLCMVLFLAGLSKVPRELYEAATPRRGRHGSAVLRGRAAGAARRARGRDHADGGRGAAHLRPGLRDDRAADRARRPGCRRTRSSAGRSTTAEVGYGVTIALVLTVIIMVLTDRRQPDRRSVTRMTSRSRRVG